MFLNRKSVLIGLLYAVSLVYLTERISVDTDTWDAPGHALPCGQHFTYARDRKVHATGNASAAHRPWIPRTVHFLVPSRCLPSAVASIHEAAWKNEPKLSDHSVLYHDQAELDRYMASDRHKKVFPSIELAYACAKDARAKLDIARFLVLWEFGGIAVDADLIPGPAFLRNDAASNGTEGILIEDRDESLVEVDRGWRARPRFLAAEPRHPALFVAIETFLASSVQRVRDSTGPRALLAAAETQYWVGDYAALRRRYYAGFDPKFYHGSHDGTAVKNYRTNKDGFMPNKIVQIRVDEAIQGALFESIRLTQIEERALELTVRSQRQEQCELVESKLKDHSYQTDIESLIKMAGAGAGAEKERDETCPEGQKRVPSKFDAHSMLPGRKIPKIIHMTAKSSCFTPRFAENVEKWRFPGHSLFMYDDAAMDRLFHHVDWPEFPLLREVLSCIPSGGGKADLWRYLMLWEYGGIYTDIVSNHEPGVYAMLYQYLRFDSFVLLLKDNAPGVGLLNGTIIDNHTDSFFEQERGGFPSQYFMAGEFGRFTQTRLLPA